MSKAKSVVITVILALAVAVAVFFAAISFPVENNVKRLNSIASRIHLGADLSGYAYTTVYPEGVITGDEYKLLDTDEKEGYKQVGSLYVEKEWLTENGYADVDALKTAVASDAAEINKRFGKRGLSSYSVALEDGVAIKVSVPTNFSYASYKGNDEVSHSSDLSLASVSLGYLTAYGDLTLRTTDASISLTDASGNSITYDSTKRGKDKWVDKASPDGGTTKSYSLADGDDAADYFKSITSRTVGSTAIITFNFTKEGREKFEKLTTRAASSSSQTIYFFVGETQLLSFSCTEAVNRKSLSLSASNVNTATSAAIALNSAANGGALQVSYRNGDSEVSDIRTSTAAGGENAALFTFIASILVLAGLSALLIVKYKKLGAVTAFMAVIFALVELYALYLLNIQLTFAVVFTAAILLVLFTGSCAIVFEEVRRLTASGRTVQASVKEAYKNVLMTVTDMHIVLVVLAILLATVGVGEVAACGLLSVIGVVASYVLYWFTRFMWYVTSSPERDKFGFAGLKRVEYEDD